jgi:uncharacterized cupin superfamily protein
MSEPGAHVLNAEEAEESSYDGNAHFRCHVKRLTPRGAALGVRLNRVPPASTACPFHTHQLEHEAFFIVSGRGVLRYGDSLRELRAGDCVYCPAGTGLAHQLANPFDAELVYLSIGTNDPNEVCTYPDSGKVMVRCLKRVGVLEDRAYLAGEPESPAIFELFASSARV